MAMLCRHQWQCSADSNGNALPTPMAMQCQEWGPSVRRQQSVLLFPLSGTLSAQDPTNNWLYCDFHTTYFVCILLWLLSLNCINLCIAQLVLDMVLRTAELNSNNNVFARDANWNNWLTISTITTSWKLIEKIDVEQNNPQLCQDR